MKSNKNFKIVNIYRNPLEQIKSLKINILLRGGVSKGGFNGALSGKSNVYNYYITSIIDQYKFIKKKNQILHFKLDDLRPIKFKVALTLSNYFFNKIDINFVKFLIKSSRLKDYKNKYFDLKRESQSFRLKEIQEPFNLDFLLNKKNIKNFMYSYEKLFYLIIFKSLIVKKFKPKKFVYFYLLIMSLIFGFKDISKNLPFRIFLRKRINSFKVINNAKKLLMYN